MSSKWGTVVLQTQHGNPRKKDRWQIELFFKALKQNLKINTFVGTNSNVLYPVLDSTWEKGQIDFRADHNSR